MEPHETMNLSPARRGPFPSPWRESSRLGAYQIDGRIFAWTVVEPRPWHPVIWWLRLRALFEGRG